MDTNLILEIEMCLGSACFARGNNSVLSRLNEFVVAKGLEKQVRLRGSLCHGTCKDGPNVRINGKVYTSVDAAGMIEIVRRLLSIEDL